MPICPKCAAGLEMPDAIFCPYCGKKIAQKRPRENRITNLDYINIFGKDAALTVMREMSGMDVESAAKFLYEDREPIPVFVVIVSYLFKYRRCNRSRLIKREHMNKKHLDYFKENGLRYHDYRTDADGVSCDDSAVIERTTLRKSTKSTDLGTSVFLTEGEAIEFAVAAGWGDVLK